MSETDLTIVLPVFNERQTLEHVLCDLIELLDGDLRQLQCEIIIVNDGSDDGSIETIRKFVDRRVILIEHPYNIGNGAAIKTGIRNAKGNLVLMMDGDGQHDISDIPLLLAQCKKFDMVVGARTKRSNSSWHRNLANSVYNLLASYVCGRKIEDLTSGFRIIRTRLAQEFVYLLPNTFSYPATITLAILKGGYSLQYVPITTKERAGTSKINLLADGSRFFIIILRIAVFFSPLKIFLPLSLMFFGTGFIWYIYRVFIVGTGFPPVSSLLITASVLIFLIGLVSEQITYLRYGQK